MRWLDSWWARFCSRPERERPAARLEIEALEARTVMDATTNVNFVAQAYRDLLGREADLGGLTFFSKALNQGTSNRVQVVLNIEQSLEYRTDEVQSLYQELLHRPGEATGVGLFTTFLGAGGTVEQVAAIMAGSPEYYLNRGGGTSDGFLDALYGDVLGRAVDPAGRAFFDSLLAQGTNRTLVAFSLLSSTEYRQDLVQRIYQQYLHRPADPSGLATFTSALQLGARDEAVIAVILASGEYSPLDSPDDGNSTVLTADEVRTMLSQAAAASASNDAIIAIVDRGGRILGVRAESGVSATIMNDPQLLAFAVDGAVAEARTGAFFANDQAPLTSRTVQFISQTTLTQREIQSNPNITDPNSPLRGPGFVGAIGTHGHFPPGVQFTPQVDLFAIEHTNRDSILHPGADGLKSPSDFIELPNRFNIADANIPATIPVNQRLQPPESYGLVSGIAPFAQARGIGTLPGGLPLYKDDAQGRHHVVGGIGVFFPGTTGFATEENSILDVTYDPNKRDRSLEAEFIATTVAGPAILRDFPGARLDLVGITLDVIGPGGTQGLDTLMQFGATLGHGDPNNGTNLLIRAPGADGRLTPSDFTPVPGNILAGTPVPEGWLVTPHDGAGISAADVVKTVTQGIAQAVQTRAAIRLPLSVHTSMVFAVSDLNGQIVGLFRMPDSTVFSIDVAVAKSRNVAYYANPNLLQSVDQLPGVPAGVAFTNRTFRFLALPRYPEGIDGSPPGFFSILNDGGANPITGVQVGAPLPASAFQSVQGYDAFHPGTNFRDPLNPANQNGIVFFPGAVPLYHSALIGGFGVSGDGVDQDDVVTFFGAGGLTPPANVARADQIIFRDVRLPYQKFNRNPEGGLQ